MRREKRGNGDWKTGNGDWKRGNGETGKQGNKENVVGC